MCELGQGDSCEVVHLISNSSSRVSESLQAVIRIFDDVTLSQEMD